MDQTIVDLTPLVNLQEQVRPGQEVTVIDNDPHAPNSVEALADQLETIPYEIITSLGPRIVRVSIQ